jgi:hypothetical protein
VTIDLQASDTRSPEGFTRAYVNMGAVPAPWWDQYRTLSPSAMDKVHPNSTYGVWGSRLHHDTGGEFLDERWIPEDGTKEAGTKLGQLIAWHLRQDKLPLLLSLLDRQVLLAQIHQPTWHVRAALLADAGPSQELDKLLTKYETTDSRAFVQWARGYADGKRAE